jgi:Skp family chaperone for outer membrane proteins
MNGRSGAWAGLLAGLALWVSGNAWAASTNFGYIDSARIFSEYANAKDAQQRFDRLVQGWRDEASEKEKAVNQLRQEVRDQAPILSALKRQERETALQRAINEYESFVQEIWGPNGRAAQENERATSEVVTDIRAAVEKVATQRNLEVVLDAAGGFLVYADKSLDLTPDVLTELATKAKSTSH